MHKVSSGVQFFLNLSKTETILSHRLDRGLGGLGWNEFLILFQLDQAKDQSLSRIELAGRVGLTASGITRILLPMEKVHLITSGPVEADARVRAVMIAEGGKTRLSEAISRIEEFAEELFDADEMKETEKSSEFLCRISGKILMS